MRLPPWFRQRMPSRSAIAATQDACHHVHTVCEQALCPNSNECFAHHTAAFLALGSACTRKCAFCAIDFSPHPPPPDPDEPQRIADAVITLALSHVIITQVTRDDLPDGGAAALCSIITTIRKKAPEVTIEVLSSDFAGNIDALEMLLHLDIDVFNHNVEAVERLTPRIRHKASWERSLQILRYAARRKVQHRSPRAIKSGLMLGFGETKEEVIDAIRQLQGVPCDILTLGQYLQPTPKSIPVHEFIPPACFDEYRKIALAAGIPVVHSSPHMRSSYSLNATCA